MSMERLTNGINYCQLHCDFGKGDFYGYRSQGMAAIKRWMILYGIWEM